MRSFSILIILAAVGVCGIRLHAQTPTPAPQVSTAQAISPEKEKAIRQLLAVTGTSKLMDQMMTQMMASFRTGFPDVPPAYWAKIGTRMKSDDLVALLIPVYDKYYTLEDVNGLLAFYQTPLGQKVIATTPQVSRESMTIGQVWGRKQAQAVMQEIQQEEDRSKSKARSQ